MQDIYVGLFIGIILMSLFATIGMVLIDSNNDFGCLLLGPVMWLALFCLFIFNAIIAILKPKQMTLFYFENLKKQNIYYRHLFGNYHMLRYYGNKKANPLLYHFIIIKKIIIVPEKIRMR